MFILLIAKPRNQGINTRVQDCCPTSREGGRGIQDTSGERTEAGVRIVMVKYSLPKKKKKEKIPPSHIPGMTITGE